MTKAVRENYHDERVRKVRQIRADEFCKDLLTPVTEAYENEKARILGDVGEQI